MYNIKIIAHTSGVYYYNVENNGYFHSPYIPPQRSDQIIASRNTGNFQEDFAAGGF